jgi:hypothetical protein
MTGLLKRTIVERQTRREKWESLADSSRKPTNAGKISGHLLVVHEALRVGFLALRPVEFPMIVDFSVVPIAKATVNG